MATTELVWSLSKVILKQFKQFVRIFCLDYVNYVYQQHISTETFRKFLLELYKSDTVCIDTFFDFDKSKISKYFSEIFQENLCFFSFSPINSRKALKSC